MCIVHISERYQGHDEKNTGVSMAGAPQVLPQRVRGVAGVMKEQVKKPKAPVDDSGKNHKEDACHSA